MNKIHKKIMEFDYAAGLKRLIILTICLALIGSVLNAFMFSTQIKEVISEAGRFEVTQSSDDSGGIEKKIEHQREHEDFFDNVSITKPSAAALISAGVTALLCSLAALIFWLMIAAWLYKEATLSGMHGSVWLILGLIGNIFAAVIFIFVRSFIRCKCSACGSFQPKDARYCSNCGSEIYEKCANCGAFGKAGMKFCNVCGKEYQENKN